MSKHITAEKKVLKSIPSHSLTRGFALNITTQKQYIPIPQLIRAMASRHFYCMRIFSSHHESQLTIEFDFAIKITKMKSDIINKQK